MINQMVVSTEIEWVGYEHSRQVLQVQFLAGGVYQYDGVPEYVYEAFLEADSHGLFFAENVKGRYPFRRIS